MAKMLEPMIGELQQEAVITRRVLERIPGDKLSWRPHAKSMSIGQLGLHIAAIPGRLSKLAQLDQFDVTNANFNPPEPQNTQEILATLDESVKTAQAYFESASDASAAGNWSLVRNGQPVFTVPRAGMLRSILLNHWYHHRGQMSVYLRLLEIPVPVIYGRSADESPFD